MLFITTVDNKKQFTKMRKLTLALFILLSCIGAVAQSTHSVNVKATIVTPDNICSLAMNTPEGNLFTLANGHDNCFDITLCSLDPLNVDENIFQSALPEMNYSLVKSELPSTNDLQISIPIPASGSPGYTLSIHYN